MSNSRFGRTALILTVALTIAGDALLGQSSAPNSRRIVVLDGREVIEGEVIVRYRARAGWFERERAEVQAGSDFTETIGIAGARRLRSRQRSTRQLLAALRANPDVVYAEPNFIIRATAVPNDPSIDQLWGLINTGQVVDGHAGVPGADIGAAAAWDIATGSRSTVVAVLDTGIDFSHPDLAANMFTAPRAFSVTVSGITVSCAAGTHGFDALTNSCIPVDENGHGTHVAGIIGAVGNNGVGVTGVNWTASLMALKVLGADGNGTTVDAIKAIDFAMKAKAALGADANVRILNASWGGADFSIALNEQIQQANSADMLFVAAAGSDGTNNDVVPHYPSSSSNSNVISVAAVDNTGALASFSNYGASSVHLAAPGASTYSTFPNGAYGYLSGTSMAAPLVSGAAALVLSACPSTTATLKSRLLNTVDPHSTLSGTTRSGGRLNVGRALADCLSTLHATISGTTITATVVNSPGQPNDWLALYCPASSADAAYLDWKYLNGTRTAPSTGLTSATVTFQAPPQAVSCNVRLLSNNSLVTLATSETVSPSTESTLTIGDVNITEGNSGTSQATFTVTLAPVNASQTVTVNYATANGTASTADADYAAVSGTLTFTPSAATQTINVAINGDTAVEGNETFVLNLSGAINASIGDAQATATITNDDGAASPAVSVASTSVQPGGIIQFTVTGGPANAMDWVTLSLASAADTTYLDWNYLNGSKTAPASGVSGATLQFTAPSTPGSYNIRLYTNNKLIKLATSATITVASAPAQPTLTIADVNIAEGQGGGSAATFTVTLAPVNATQTVTVNYASADGTATVSNDYVSASGTLTFTPSTATQSFTVTINGDTAVESSETFVINLSGATNAAIGDAQAIGTISNDDGSTGPAVNLASTSVQPGGVIQFTISGGPANPADWVTLSPASAADNGYVDWNYLNGTKTAPAVGQSGATLQFTAPATPGNYNVRFFANNSLANRLATSATIVVATQPAQPTLTIGDVAIAEGNSGVSVATVTVTLSPVNASQTVTVNYATANGTATIAGDDYAAAAGTLTFTPSTATQTINVPVNGDTAIESTETFVVELSSATNATIGDAQATVTITNDDGATGPAVSVASTSVPPGGVVQFTVSGGPANSTDWVTFSPASAADNGYLDWNYLNGTKSAPATGQSGATLQFTAPATPGAYNVRFFANNSLAGRLATSATITVASQPTLTIGDVSVTEGNSGTSVATFTVTLAPLNMSQTVTVNYAATNGVATTANDDYVAASGTLSFAPSIGTQTISVTINGDTAVEPSETFVVVLSGATNAVVGDAQATGTILNDDGPASPAVSVASTSVQPGALISFTVSGGPANPTDWVTLSPSGAADNGYLDWNYLNGSRTAPVSGQSGGTLQFIAPATPGTYNLRFFANNRLSDRLATSATFTVAP